MTARTFTARVRHRMPGRMRLSIDSGDDVASISAAADAISALAGVETVETRTGSGSLIIHHTGALGDDALASAGIVCATRGAPPRATRDLDPIRETRAAIAQANAALLRASGGSIDLWGLAFGGLVVGGVVQAARGRIAGPALTLFGQAATLAMAKPLRQFLG